MTCRSSSSYWKALIVNQKFIVNSEGKFINEEEKKGEKNSEKNKTEKEVDTNEKEIEKEKDQVKSFQIVNNLSNALKRLLTINIFFLIKFMFK